MVQELEVPSTKETEVPKRCLIDGRMNKCTNM